MKHLKNIFVILFIISGSLNRYAYAQQLTKFQTPASSISSNLRIRTYQLEQIEKYNSDKVAWILQKPPVSESKIFSEVGVGIIFSVVGGAAGVGLGYFLDVVSIFGGLPYLHLSEIGYLTGSVIGSYFGVILIGINKTQTGNKYATFSGSLIGGLINYAIPQGVYHDPYTDIFNTDNIPKLLLSSISSTVLATLAFNITRGYKQTTSLNIHPTMNGMRLTYRF